MLVAGDYSDSLRAIGRFFEEIKAAEIKVADQGKTLHISWRDQSAARQQRQFDAHQVAGLRSLAVAYRGTQLESLGFRASELMRALGQELDNIQADQITIDEQITGFHVSGLLTDSPFERHFSYSDLVAKAVEGRQSRAAEMQQRLQAQTAQRLSIGRA
jgi:hypothetical protein